MDLPAIELGAFELLRLDRSGGMGEIWQGVGLDFKGRRVPVGVKVLTSEGARDDWYLRAFRNEVRAMAGLDHPSIIQVYDQGRVTEAAEASSGGRLQAGSPYLVMEWASGGTLRDLTVVESFAELRDVLTRLLDALAHAHSRGVVHRDLKPVNVLLAVEGDARPGLKLADFGLARPHDLEGRLDAGGGTPAFMAPEQVAGSWRDQGPWTDLYALGCLAWRLATGEPPFVGSDMEEVRQAHLNEALPPFAAHVPLPPGFEGWLRRLLARSPRDRYRLAADASFALQELVVPPESRVAHTPVGKVPGQPPAQDTFHTFAALPETDTEEDQPWSEVVCTAPGLARQQHVELPPMNETWRGEVGARVAPRLPGAGLGLYGLGTARLVGREWARDSLWGALRQVRRDRRPRVVVLRGPAGCGKSHLSRWLRERANELGCSLHLAGHFGPTAGAGQGLAAMLSRHLRLNGLDPDEVQERLYGLLYGLPGVSLEELEALGDYLAPDHSQSLVDQPSERFALIARLLQHLGSVRPLVVGMDDVQWGLEALDFAGWVLDMQEHTGAPCVPALFVFTVEEDALQERRDAVRRLEELLERKGAVSIDIPVMSATDLDGLLRGQFGLERVLAQAVAERSGGLPLYAVQLVEQWVRSGSMVGGSQGHRLCRAEELPDGLGELWGNRLERVLPEWPVQARTALEVAALLGQVLSWEEWTAICGHLDFDRPGDLVEALLEERLVVCGDGGPEGGWSFVHGHLRHAMERTARSQGRLPVLHEASAAVLQALILADPSAATSGREHERLAHHLLEAGQEAEALDPLLLAIQRRISEADARRAEELLLRWEHAAARTSLGESDPRWGEALLHRARLHRLMGRLSMADTCLVQVERQGRRHGWDTALLGALRDRGRIAHERGDPDLADALLAEMEEQAERLGEARAHFDARHERGQLRLGHGDLAGAEEHFQAALDGYRAGGDQRRLALALLGLADVAHQRGEVDEARAWVDRGLNAYRTVGSRWGTANCHNKLGDLCRGEGELELAEHHYRAALASFRAVRSGSVAYAELNLALVLGERGELRLALETLQSCLNAFQGQRRQQMIAATQACMSWVLAARGSWTEAAACLEQAERLLDQTSFVDADLGTVLERTAEACFHGGQEDLGRRALERARSQWEQLGRVDRVGACDQRKVLLDRTLGPRRMDGSRTVTLDDFELYDEIGHGGMGQVWQGRHRASGREVAVKVVTRRALRSPRIRQAFRTEVQAVAALDHPHVVDVYDQGVVDVRASRASGRRIVSGSPYLVMAIAPEGTVGRRVDDRGRLDWATGRRLLGALLDALAYAHARGIFHLDIKPANILLGGQPGGALRTVLTDFGLSVVLGWEDELEDQSLAGHTALYVSPEQATGKLALLGPWSDLYSLGITAAHLIGGMDPARVYFSSEPGRGMPAELIQLEERGLVPRGFGRWLGRMSADAVRDRFQSAAEAWRALVELGPAPADAPSPVPEGLEVFHRALFPDPDAPGQVPSSWGPGGEETASLREGGPPPGAGLGLVGLRELPVVGRVEERDRLWQVLDEVVSGPVVRVVTLAGDRGAGKSRLAEWLAHRVRELGLATVMRAAAGREPGPGQGIGPMLRRHFSCTGVSGAALRSRLQGALALLGVEDPVDLSALVELIDTELPAGGAGTGKEHILVVARLLRTLAAQAPLVLWLEDLHWDAEAQALVEELLLEPEGAAVMVVATVLDAELDLEGDQRGRLHRLTSSPGLVPVQVGPLSDGDIATLIQSMLGFHPEVGDALVARSEGNPLLPIQLVGQWVDRGDLVPDGGGYSLAEGATLSLPASFQELWEARIDRLLERRSADPSVRRVLEFAAALGAIVDREEWQEACAEVGLEVPEGLVEHMVGVHLARSEGREAWSFVQGMVRDALLGPSEGTPAHTELHRTCARVLARRGGRGADERVALHLLKAGDREAALEPLSRAIEARVRSAVPDPAHRLLDLGDHAATTQGLPEDHLWWARAALFRSRLARIEGDFDTVQAQAARALSLAERLEEPAILAGALRELGSLRWVGHQLQHPQLSPWRERLGATGEALADARVFFEEAINHSMVAGDRSQFALFLGLLGQILRQQGKGELAEAQLGRSLEEATAAGDLFVAGIALSALGLCLLSRGALDEAEGAFNRALSHFEEVGSSWGVAEATNGLGEVARARGKLLEAIGFYERSRDRYRSIRSSNTLFQAVNLAQVQAALGRWGAALHELEDSARVARQGERPLLADVIDVLRLHPLAVKGRWAEVAVVLEGPLRRVEEAQLFEADMAASLVGALVEWMVWAGLLGPELGSGRRNSEGEAELVVGWRLLHAARAQAGAARRQEDLARLDEWQALLPPVAD